jgi:alkylation response protein AidB-like acyl-CoA dehydrogenase
VFAAEGGDDPLTATRVIDGWLLSGTKPWCSLAARLDRALVSAHTEQGGRRLFAVDLTRPGTRVVADAWHARGLAEIPSGPVLFHAAVGVPVGDDGWYLSRPGFAWGGIGVAACWFGGAVGVARTVHAAARDDKPFALMHLGAIDELIHTARRALAEAAELVDAGADDGAVLALRVRATVARACEDILDRAAHALGPAPLALDAAHAKRVADLQLYVRQHHAERDQHALGRALLGSTPW